MATKEIQVKQSKVASKVLIRSNGYYLALKGNFKGDDYWDIPGGKIEYGETPIEAARRECFEELGVWLDELTLIGYGQFITRNKTVQITYLLFLSTFQGKPEINININPSKTEAIQKLEWMEYDKLISLLTQNSHKMCVINKENP